MFEDLKPEPPVPAPLREESSGAAELNPNTPNEAAPPSSEAALAGMRAPLPAGTMAVEAAQRPAGGDFEEPMGAEDSEGAPGSGDLEEPAEAGESELAGWKAALRWDFERWLAGIEQIPEADPDELAEEAPDLYAFYAQLAAANAESRKANRRTAEAISQWVETVSRFETSLAPLRESINQLAAVQAKEGRMSRAHCLALIELLDRLQRIAKAFLSPPGRPRRRWWGGAAEEAWPRAWDSQRQAFGIVLGHLEELLSKEGVVRLDTLGQRFDPLLMTAVAAEPDPMRPPQTVIEELAPGYRRQDELLRPAQVKVTTK
jgi:hypothetical protein